MTNLERRRKIEKVLAKEYFDPVDLVIFALDTGLEKVFKSMEEDGMFDGLTPEDIDELWDMVYELPEKISY